MTDKIDTSTLGRIDRRLCRWQHDLEHRASIGLAGHADFAATVFPGWRMPASLVRFNISALIATIRVLRHVDGCS